MSFPPRLAIAVTSVLDRAWPAVPRVIPTHSLLFAVFVSIGMTASSVAAPVSSFLVGLAASPLSWTEAAGDQPSRKELQRKYAELKARYDEEKTKTAFERKETFRELAQLRIGPAYELLFAEVRDPKGDVLAKSEIVRAFAGEELTPEAAQFLLGESFQHLHERTWKVVGEVLATANDVDGLTWIVEKGYRAIPSLPNSAQMIVVEGLANIEDPRTADAAAKLLGNRKCPTQVQAEFIRILRLRKHDKAIKAVVKVFKWQDKDCMVEALRYLRAVQASEQSKLLYDALESDHWEVRATALDIMGATRNPELLRHLTPLLEDRTPAVQLAAIHAVRGIGGNDAIDPLLALLEDAEGRVKDDVIDALVWLTGKDFGASVASWTGWWEANRDKVTIAGITREEYEELLAGTAGGQTSTYYGLRVISNFVTFVVDTSGSMEEKYEVPQSAVSRKKGDDEEEKGLTGVRDKDKEDEKSGGGKKKSNKIVAKKIEVAKTELVRVLASVRKGTQFNMVSFASLCSPWRQELVAMDDETLGSARDWVEDLKSGGETNVYEALIQALADPKVDTIYFLSDGAPTAGKVQNPKEILDRVTEANALRKVKIHTIGFKLDPVAKKLMQKLAEQNYGTFLDK